MNDPSTNASQGNNTPWQPPDTLVSDITALRRMSLKERGQRIAMACRAAARIEQSRRQMGLAASQSVPWHQSTWDFLKRSAEHVTR